MEVHELASITDQPMELVNPTSPEDSSDTLAPRAAPVLPPLVLALGRGFTLFGWAAVILVNGLYGVTVGWGLGWLGDFLVTAFAGFLFVFLFEGLAVLLWKLLKFLLPRLRLSRANTSHPTLTPGICGGLLGIPPTTLGDFCWAE